MQTLIHQEIMKMSEDIQKNWSIEGEYTIYIQTIQQQQRLKQSKKG